MFRGKEGGDFYASGGDPVYTCKEELFFDSWYLCNGAVPATVIAGFFSRQGRWALSRILEQKLLGLTEGEGLAPF